MNIVIARITPSSKIRNNSNAQASIREVIQFNSLKVIA